MGRLSQSCRENGNRRSDHDSAVTMAETTSLSPDERRLAKLAPELQPAAVRAKLGTPEFIEAVFAQEYALATIRMQEEEEQRSQHCDSRGNELWIGPRA